MYTTNIFEIAQNASLNAFESFLADGGVNSPDMYFQGEPEDFSPEADLALMRGLERYIREPGTELSVIGAPEYELMQTA